MAKNGSDTTNGALDALEAQINDAKQFLAGLVAAHSLLINAKIDAEDAEAVAPKVKRTRGPNKAKRGLPAQTSGEAATS